MAGEFLARKYDIRLNEKRFSSICGIGEVAGQKTMLLLPQTYMNNSGVAVKAAMEYYSVAPDSLVVVHDDIELPFGQVREKLGGGHKGQNGIRSIIQHAGTADFHRIRIGVGRPSIPEMAVADYLLSNFNVDELERMEEILAMVQSKAEAIIMATSNN